MKILKMLLVLCVAIPTFAVAASECAEMLPQTSAACHTDTPLVIYQPDDVLLKDYAPYQKRIRVLFDYLAAHPSCGLRLEGHVDQRKSSEYSFGLAQRSADSVQKYLVSQGFDPDRIMAVSYGKEKPVDLRHNSRAWAKNRRVEIKLYQMAVHHGSSDADSSGAK